MRLQTWPFRLVSSLLEHFFLLDRVFCIKNCLCTLQSTNNTALFLALDIHLRAETIHLCLYYMNLWFCL